MIPLITLLQEADIEKDSVIAMLDSALRVRGSAQEFARAANISPVYVSYVRAGRRMPRVRTAEQMTPALLLPVEQREAWVAHVGRFWELKKQARGEREKGLRGRLADAEVDAIRAAHQSAQFAPRAELAKTQYRVVRDGAAELLADADPNRDPINYLELAFVLHDAQCVLNRNDEALWYGKRARLITASLEPRDYPRQRERVDFFHVNAIRAEAIAFHNLRLYRQAERLCEEIEQEDGFKRNAPFWITHLNRDRINALEGQPRFSIKRAEEWARAVWRVCDTRADAYDPLMRLLISQSLARAYIKHENFKDAHRLLRAEWDHLDQVPHLGPLHRVMLARTYARLYWREGERGEAWEFFAAHALETAARAGLEDQRTKMREEFGAALDALDLDARTADSA